MTDTKNRHQDHAPRCSRRGGAGRNGGKIGTAAWLTGSFGSKLEGTVLVV